MSGQRNRGIIPHCSAQERPWPMPQDLHLLSACDAARLIAEGELTSQDLVKACLTQIGDDPLNAWAHLDPDDALDQARACDQQRASGANLGTLHGVPVALKDIVDTRRFPTERGSPIWAGRQPDTDAALVTLLQKAGAVIMGKTKTTEMAFVHPTDTLNPHNPQRSPGGSSSGSAAAVAAHHVPLAIGTQTGGSVVRPASFCGIYGLKPSRGRIPRSGVFQTSVTLDHVGTFARSLSDLACLTDAVTGFDPGDVASDAEQTANCLVGITAQQTHKPKIAFLDFEFHDQLETDTRACLNAMIAQLGDQVTYVPVPEALSGLVDVHLTIYEYEFCQHLAETLDTRWDDLSDSLKPIVHRGRTISTDHYNNAQTARLHAETACAALFQDFDAIIAPAATGQAPLLASGHTGDPLCCRVWSLAGLPSVTLPLMSGKDALPIGLQLIGAHGQDDHLLRNAAWLDGKVAPCAATR